MPVVLKPRTFSLPLPQQQAKAQLQQIPSTKSDWNSIGKSILVRFPKQFFALFFSSQLRPTREDWYLNRLIIRGKNRTKNAKEENG